jgi:hypothetical protein
MFFGQRPNFNGGAPRAARRVGSQRDPTHQIRTPLYSTSLDSIHQIHHHRQSRRHEERRDERPREDDFLFLPIQLPTLPRQQVKSLLIVLLVVFVVAAAHGSRNDKTVGGGAGLVKGSLQICARDCLDAAVSEQNVAGEMMPRSRPCDGSVRRKFHKSGFYRNATNFKVVVARKKCLRIF